MVRYMRLALNPAMTFFDVKKSLSNFCMQSMSRLRLSTVFTSNSSLETLENISSLPLHRLVFMNSLDLLVLQTKKFRQMVMINEKKEPLRESSRIMKITQVR
jgi:hypothetical protein